MAKLDSSFFGLLDNEDDDLVSLDTPDSLHFFLTAKGNFSFHYSFQNWPIEDTADKHLTCIERPLLVCFESIFECSDRKSLLFNIFTGHNNSRNVSVLG